MCTCVKDSIETSVEDDTKKEKKKKKKGGPGKGWVGGGWRYLTILIIKRDIEDPSCCGRVCVWCTACRHTAPALHSSTACIGLYPPHALSPSDLLCLRSSRSKYNASTINYYLLFFLFFSLLLHFYPKLTILITERVFCLGLLDITLSGSVCVTGY